MENWIDVITGFLVVSSALLLALGVLSGLILHVFRIVGKTRLLICSMLIMMPVAYPVASLVPDHHKFPLPAEKLQEFFPGTIESGNYASAYSSGQSAGPGKTPSAGDESATIRSSAIRHPTPSPDQTPSVVTNWKWIFAALWAALFFFILIRALFFSRKLRRLVQYADPVTDLTVLAMLRKCRAETGLRKSPRLLVVNHMPPPMAVGFLHPSIILPARLLAPSFREGLRFTLLHELKHLRRRDNWWLLIELVVGAVYFFHPVIHWAKRKIHEEWEHICDRHVVRVTKKPAAYADFLLHEIWRHGHPTGPSLAVPLLFNPRRTAERVHCILQKLRPTLFSRIRNRIAVGTVFVCFVSVFLCTLTPSAYVNDADISHGETGRARFAVNDKPPAVTTGDGNLKPASTGNGTIFENRDLQKPKHENVSVTKSEPASAVPEPAPVSNATAPIRQENAQDASAQSPGESEKQNSPRTSPTEKETPWIGTAGLPPALGEKAAPPEDVKHQPGNGSLFETSDLLAVIDPESMRDWPEMAENVSNISSVKNTGADRVTAETSEDLRESQSATERNGEPASKNIAIPMGARIFDWKVIDDRNIIVRTRFYGSFKATLAEDYPELSRYRKDLKFDSNWPYELDENSKVILPNDDTCEIQTLVPHGKIGIDTGFLF